MGLEIRCDESAPIPRRTDLRLICDHHEGASEVFDHGDYVANMHAAMVKGWMEKQTGQGREFWCPACSGKKTTPAHGMMKKEPYRGGLF